MLADRVSHWTIDPRLPLTNVIFGIAGEMCRPVRAGSSFLTFPSLRLGLSTDGPLALRRSPEKTEHVQPPALRASEGYISTLET
jgi:hypothetical protein